RMTVWPQANAPSKNPNPAQAKKLRLIIAPASGQHRQHNELGLLLSAALPVADLLVADAWMGIRGRSTADQVGQRRILQNPGGCIPYFQEHFVQGAMVGIDRSEPAAAPRPQTARAARQSNG